MPDETTASCSEDKTRLNVIGTTDPRLIEEMIGIFAESPNFDEVMRSIEAERERERHEAEREASQS